MTKKYIEEEEGGGEVLIKLRYTAQYTVYLINKLNTFGDLLVSPK